MDWNGFYRFPRLIKVALLILLELQSAENVRIRISSIRETSSIYPSSMSMATSTETITKYFSKYIY